MGKSTEAQQEQKYKEIKKRPTSERPHGITFGEGKTKQSFKDECDINRIVDNFMKTGMISSINERKPVFADVSNIPDFQTARNIVITGQNMFMQLPATVREKFKNDPAELVRWIQDPKNKNEAIELGLLPKEKTAPPNGGASEAKNQPPPAEKQPEKKENKGESNANVAKKD